jgi:endoglucanase
MPPDPLDLLRRLTDADGVPGHEAEVRAIFEAELKSVATIEHDRLGSVYATRVGDPSGPRVLLDSHIDCGPGPIDLVFATR